VPSEKRARQRAGREARRAALARHQRRRRLLRSSILVVVVGAVIVGSVALATHHSSAPKSPQATATAAAVAAGCPSNPHTRVNTLSFKSAPPMTINTSGTYSAIVKTTAGDFRIALDPKIAPVTVNNFVFLARKGFYRCVIFHRVIPGFVDQTGDPTGTGQGGPGYTIPDEFPPAAANAADQYPLGSVAMANTGQPHSGGSQWFIVAGPKGESLPNRYSLFGKVVSGMRVVEKINREGTSSGAPKVVQRILSIKITSS